MAVTVVHPDGTELIVENGERIRRNEDGELVIENDVGEAAFTAAPGTWIGAFDARHAISKEGSNV